MARFEPHRIDSKPMMNVPHIEPKLFIAAIQESSSFVKGPVIKGVSSDKRIGKAGENQPILLPKDRIMQLANEGK